MHMMHSMQRPGVFILVHQLLPGFELQTSDVPKQQMKTPANRRTGEVTASNVQHYKLVHRRIGVHRRIDYHQSAYQNSNVQHNRLVHRRSGVPANRRPASHRIRFQRTTQQIGTPANRRTGVSDSNVQHNRLVHRRSGVPVNRRTASRRIRFQHSTQQIGTPANRRTGVSDSNVQHNRLVHRRIGVPACQIPTFNTTDWYTGESAYRRIRSNVQHNRLVHHRIGISDSNVQHNRLVHRRSGVPANRRPASRRIRFQRSTQQIGTPANRRTGEPASQLPTVDVDKTDRRSWTNSEALMVTVLQPLAVNGHSRGRPSLLPTRRARRPLGPSNFQKCVSQLKTSSPFIVKKSPVLARSAQRATRPVNSYATDNTSSKASWEVTGEPANRRTGEPANRRPANRQTGEPAHFR